MKLDHILVEHNLLLELGDSPYPWTWVKDPAKPPGQSGEAKFSAMGNNFEVQLHYRSDLDQVTIFWTMNDSFRGSDSENSYIRAMFTIMDIIKSYVTTVHPKYIKFEAGKGGEVRSDRNRLASMYTAMVKRFAVKAGYSTTIDNSNPYEAAFTLTRRDKKRRLN